MGRQSLQALRIGAGPAAGVAARLRMVPAQKVKVLGEGGTVTQQGVRLECAAKEGKELITDRVQPQQQPRVPLGGHLLNG